MKSTLDKYLDNVQFNHIDTVLEAFELCENLDDVYKVIGEVPNKFGSFTVELMDEDGNTYDPDDFEEDNAQLITGFCVTNLYTFYDDYAEDTHEFEWYQG